MSACEMPLVANIITRSGSTSDADFRQHDVLQDCPFRRKEGGPRLRGDDMWYDNPMLP